MLKPCLPLLLEFALSPVLSLISQLSKQLTVLTINAPFLKKKDLFKNNDKQTNLMTKQGGARL